MPLHTDQLNRSMEIPFRPQRIVSLVPSQTELLYSLGLDREVIGITKFCVHPNEWFRNKTRIGGTKNVDIEKVKSLQPDLILANKEENRREHVELLAQHFPVWTSDVNTLDDALAMIGGVGAITGTEEVAGELQTRISQSFQTIGINDRSPIRTTYLIWKSPYMTVGGDTFIHDMMQRAGLENVFSARDRYPQITVDEMSDSGCELLLLSSEPYPFKREHIDELQMQLPGTIILLADGELFSWYGSRLLYAPSYFRELRAQALSLSDGARNR